MRERKIRHTVTISPTFADVPSAYHLIAVSDANGMNSDGTPVDPAVEFSGGVFEATDNIEYVFGTPGNAGESVTIDNEGGTNHIYIGSTDYTVPLGVAAIHVRTEEAEGGNEAVTASPPFPTSADTPVGATAATLPLWIYGGDGNDTLIGGNGGDTIVGGSGQNVIHDGNGWNSPEIVDDSDTQAAFPSLDDTFQDGGDWAASPTGQGYNGTEQVHAAAAGGSAATSSSAGLSGPPP